MKRYEEILVEDYTKGVTAPHYLHFRLMFFVQKLTGKFDWRMNF